MKNLKDMPVSEKQRYKAFVTINNSVAKPIYTTLPSNGLQVKGYILHTLLANE